ncbi:MAG: GDYXXLXY domain-containing protein, partial [Pseudomonadota bacterium]
MMKKYRIHLLVLVVVLQTAALVGMVAVKHRTLIAGRPILLETEPIDPRSLFRGDYVRLNYAIGSLDYADVEGDNDFERRDQV